LTIFSTLKTANTKTSIKMKSKKSTKATLRFAALVAGIMVMLASCGGGGHGCSAYGNKTTNTNSERLAE
jgi:hypothetical protein